MNNSLEVKEKVEVTGRIEKITWTFRCRAPIECFILLNDVDGDFNYKWARVHMSDTLNRKNMEVIENIINSEFPFVTYEALSDESIVVKVECDSDYKIYDDTVYLQGYDIELIS